MSNTTKKLGLNLLNGLETLNKSTFNDIITDVDNKCVGIAHLDENSHWALWKEDTPYTKGDIVRTTTCKSNQYFQCIVDGTSGKKEPVNAGTGAQVKDNDITWIIYEIGNTGDSSGIGIFIGGTYYTKSQPVINGGLLYRSIKDHIAQSTFQNDITDWQKVYSNLRPWTSNTQYFVDDVVTDGEKIYICISAHVSSSDMIANINSWKPLSSSGIGNFSQNKYYNKYDLIIENGSLYRCNQGYTSTTDLTTDINNWEEISGINEWKTGQPYIKGNIALYGNRIYRCINANKDATFTPSNWIRLSSGEIEDFKANHNYDENDVFKINNQLYSVKTKFTTTNADISNYVANVEPLIADISKWTSNTYYYQGMIVEYQYNLYKCETAHKSSTLFVDEDKTTNTVYWKPLGKLNTQLEYYDNKKTYNINDCVLQKEDYGASKWVSGTTYKVDEAVVYNEIIYKCITANSDTAFTESNWEEINTEKTVLYRCLKSTANAPSISSTEWEEIDCYIELASDKDIEDLFA